MKKRSTKIGTYDTATHGWTLTGWKLSDPEQKTTYVERTGGDGTWDLSTSLTDGVPRYNDRSLTITLECSQGTREDRERIIDEMVNTLDGFTWPIVPPDKPGHYLPGRVHVAVNYSDLAHAAVTIKATCGPWIYRDWDNITQLTATSAAQIATIRNAGRRAVVPVLSVTGSISLEYKGATVQLGAGAHEWPALLLTPGAHALKYSGSGSLTVTFREAVLR